MPTSPKPPTSHEQKSLRIFVSHSHHDNDFGMQLIADLRAALGSEAAVWFDVSGGLHGGDAWWRKIVGELSERPVFLVVLSPDAMASAWVNDEIDLAWKQKNSPQGKVIVPVLYRACQVREDLQTRQIVSFLPPKPYETALAELCAALGVPAPPAPMPARVMERSAAAPASEREAAHHGTPVVQQTAETAEAASGLGPAPMADADSVTAPAGDEALAPGKRDDGSIARVPVSRRTFLRQGGIATGVGLAALAGAGVLAYAARSGTGNSTGPGARSTATTTRPTTPTPLTAKPQWTKSLGAEIIGSPLFYNGYLYIGAGSGRLYAYGPNGQGVWNTSLGDNITSTPVVGTSGTLCVTANGTLYSLAIGSGAILWHKTYAPPLDSGFNPVDWQPVVASGVVYAFTLGGLSAFDAQTGAVVPTNENAPPPNGAPPLDANGFLPALAGGFIYGITAADKDAQVQQYRLSGGQPVWTHVIGSALTAPIVAGNLLYVGAADGYLRALNTSDGSQKWQSKTGDSIVQSPAYDNGVVYVASGATLYAVDAVSGTSIWQTPIGQTPIGAPACSQPVIANHVVYIGACNYIYSFDTNHGTFLRRYAVSGIASDKASSTPVIAGGTLYAATGGGTLAAFAVAG